MPLYVTEQLALQQLFGDSRTVDGNKRLCLSVAQLMNGAGDNLFPVPLSPATITLDGPRYAAYQFFN
jgi:phage gpG-like protein